MADTDDSVSSDSEEKKTVKKAPSTKKKAATTKKIVAKKGVTKKKVAKKKVAKAEAAPAPAPTSISAAPAPVWDDEASAPGLMSMVINFSPIALLLLLMLILSSPDEKTGKKAVQQPQESQTGEVVPSSNSGNVVSAELIEAIASGAIELPENFDPWAFQQGDDTAANQAWSLENLQQLEQDPGAFYWGAPAVDEAPPAPDGQ